LKLEAAENKKVSYLTKHILEKLFFFHSCRERSFCESFVAHYTSGKQAGRQASEASSPHSLLFHAMNERMMTGRAKISFISLIIRTLLLLFVAVQAPTFARIQF